MCIWRFKSSIWNTLKYYCKRQQVYTYALIIQKIIHSFLEYTRNHPYILRMHQEQRLKLLWLQWYSDTHLEIAWPIWTPLWRRWTAVSPVMDCTFRTMVLILRVWYAAMLTKKKTTNQQDITSPSYQMHSRFTSAWISRNMCGPRPLRWYRCQPFSTAMISCLNDYKYAHNHCIMHVAKLI